MLATALGLQDFRHFVGGGVGGVLLEVAGNGENGVAHAELRHTVRAAGGLGLAGGVGHRRLLSNFCCGYSAVLRLGMVTYSPLLRTAQKSRDTGLFKGLNRYIPARWRRTRSQVLRRSSSLAHSGQYLARLDFGMYQPPHRTHFFLSRRWSNSAHRLSSRGSTAARNQRQISE